MNRLPIRPEKKPDEGIFGYLIRLAKVNHFRNLQECLHLFFGRNVHMSLRRSNLSRWAEVISQLTGRAFHLEGSCSDCELSEKLKSTIGLHKFVQTEKPVICTECVKQFGYIKKAWEFTPNSYCAVHKREHINVCQECCSELKWNVKLLKLICQTCEARLESPKLFKTPEHVQLLATLKGNELEQYCDKLFDEAEKVLRPYDVMDKRVTGNPRMRKNWNGLYVLADAIIRDIQRMPSPYYLLSHPELSEHYTDYAVSSMSSVMASQIGHPPTNEQCRHYADEVALQKWLGLNKKHIQMCLSMGLLSKPLTKPSCGTSIFDFRDILKMIKGIRALASEGTPISELELEAPVFWCHKEDVIAGVLRGKIPCRFENPEEPHFSNAFVDREACHYYFRKQKVYQRRKVVPTGIVFGMLDPSAQKSFHFLKQCGVDVVDYNGERGFCTKSVQESIRTQQLPIHKAVMEACPPKLRLKYQVT